MYHKIPGNGFMKCMPQSQACVQWQAWDHGSQVNNGSRVWENWSRNGWVSTVITDTCYFNTVELWVFVCRWDWGKFCWFCVANGVANSEMTCVAGCGRIAVREELVVLVCSLRREWKWISVKTQRTSHWTEQACVVVGATEVEFSENIKVVKVTVSWLTNPEEYEPSSYSIPNVHVEYPQVKGSLYEKKKKSINLYLTFHNFRFITTSLIYLYQAWMCCRLVPSKIH